MSFRSPCFTRSLAAAAAAAAWLVAGSASADLTPLPAASVGAQALPDLAFAGVAPASLLHVAPAGDDGAAGTAQAPFRSIGRAISALQPGQGVSVHAGTYQERLELSASGSAAAPLFLLAAPGEHPVVRGGDGLSGALVKITGSYWVVDGLELDGAGSNARAVHFAQANHAVVRNAEIHSGTGPSAVYVKGSDLAILSSQIHDYTWGTDRDSHGVVIVPDSARILVQDNEISGNGGDSVQCLGPDAEPGTVVSSDVTIESNRLHDDRENAVDVKTCTRVTIRGNELSGYRPASTAPQGAALVVHMSASHVLIQGNYIHDCGRALSLGGVQPGPDPVTDVAIRENLVVDSSTDAGGSGDGFRIGTSRRVELSNNTIVRMPNSAIKVGDGSTGPAEDTRIFNNVLVDTGAALSISTGGVTGLSSDQNLAFSPGRAAEFLQSGQSLGLAAWRASTGWDLGTIEADPLFVADVSLGYFTEPGSPARDSAIETGMPSCESGLDLGAFESCPAPPAGGGVPPGGAGGGDGGAVGPGSGGAGADPGGVGDPGTGTDPGAGDPGPGPGVVPGAGDPGTGAAGDPGTGEAGAPGTGEAGDPGTGASGSEGSDGGGPAAGGGGCSSAPGAPASTGLVLLAGLAVLTALSHRRRHAALRVTARGAPRPG